MPSCFCRSNNPCEVCHACPNCTCRCRFRLRPPVSPDALPHTKRRREAALPGPPFIVPRAQPPPFSSTSLAPSIPPCPPHAVAAPSIPPPVPIHLPSSTAPAPQVLSHTSPRANISRPSPPPLRPATTSVPPLPQPTVLQSADRTINIPVSSNQPDAPPQYEAQRNTLGKVLASLGADDSALSHLPYGHSSLPFDPAKNRVAIQLMASVLQSVAKLIYPADPKGLADCFAERESTSVPSVMHERLVNSVITAMRVTRRGTVARRYVRSVLCGSMSRSEVNQLLGYPAGSPEDEGIGNSSSLNRGSSAPVDEPDDDDDECESQLVEGDRLPRMSSKTFSRSRRDWETLMERGELQAAKFGRSRVQDEALRHLLIFLFSPSNISLTSWTRRKLVVTGQKLELPAVVVSKKSSLMHEEYCRLVHSKGMKPLSRGSFYAVTKTLTRREVKRVIPVDNITESLVRDPLVLIRDLVMRVTPYHQRAKFLKQVDNVEWFLVHSYPENHIGKDSSASHDLSFALRSDALQNSPMAMFDKVVDCKGFPSPFTLLDDLYKCGALDERSTDALTLFNCRDRFLCYLALLCCKTAQDRAIESTLAEITTNRLSNRIVIFMNHLLSTDAERMSKSHLVPALENVSLHGSVVFFLGIEDKQETRPSALDSFCYNHVVCNDSGDDIAVIALVAEALFTRIRQDISHAREVVFVTDNSPMYKNDIVPSLLPHLAKASGFCALRYIYSCSQLCEFLVDAHFEVVMKFVHERLRGGDVLGPEMVVDTINRQQKVLNIAGELLSLDAAHQEFSSRLRSNKFPWIGDRNEVAYKEWIESEYEARGDQEGSSVKARVYDFAGIGRGQPFEIKGFWMKPTRAAEQNNTRQEGDCIEGRAWIGPVTGVKVVKRARRLHHMRSSSINAEDATSEGVVVDAITFLKSIIHEDSQKKKPSTTDSEGVTQDDVVASGPICSSCKRVFKSGSFLKAHNCKGTPLEKDVSARAVVVASDLFREGKLPFFRDETEQLSSPMHDSHIQSRFAPLKLCYGWARRPFGFRRPSVPDDMLETSITLKYRKEVFELLKNDPTGDKLTPFEINGTLRKRYVGRDDLPSEKRLRYWHQLHAASQRIQPYYVLGPDGIPVMSYKEPTQVSSGGKTRMSPLYISKITEMHNQHLSLPEFRRPKPRVMYREFVKFFEDEQGRLPPDFPEQKQVMNKINALRTRSRAERHQQ